MDQIGHTAKHVSSRSMLQMSGETYMLARSRFWGLLLLCCVVTAIVGCASSGLDSIQVSPATQSATVGQTVQLTAIGTYGNAKHTSTQDVTTGVTWTSNNPAIATVS